MTLDEEAASVLPSNLRVEAGSSRCIASNGQPRQKSMADYKVIKEIGEGSFSTVYVAVERVGQQRKVALKMCYKKQLIREKRVPAVHREKQVLARLSTADTQHPHIVALYATFQDNDHLYFVLTYAEYGDLWHVMNRQPGRKFSLYATKFYAAQLFSAVEHLHTFSIIHRDIKPENILVQDKGHILLSDFGSLKDLNEAPKEEPTDAGNIRSRVRRCSLVGTAQYVSPEILTGGEVSAVSDYWSFAVVIYQFLAGKHCFHDESEYLIFQRIQKLLYSFSDDFPDSAKDLVESLLKINPCERLGYVDGPSAIKAHSFFYEIDWDSLSSMEDPEIVL